MKKIGFNAMAQIKGGQPVPEEEDTTPQVDCEGMMRTLLTASPGTPQDIYDHAMDFWVSNCSGAW